ncbi:hypothetical protein [Reichenbachiella sp. MALMAid0571]|uniref:hypothetical protein n=1 Tax=Reichenbachiella sp. MALMAid0571 TaxID=3143939 RepID=UPI0032DF9806
MFKKFKELKTGVKRAVVVGTIPGAMILGGTIGALNERYYSGDDFFGYSIFLGIPLYWIVALIGVWVYDGFKENE